MLLDRFDRHFLSFTLRACLFCGIGLGLIAACVAALVDGRPLLMGAIGSVSGALFALLPVSRILRAECWAINRALADSAVLVTVAHCQAALHFKGMCELWEEVDVAEIQRDIATNAKASLVGRPFRALDLGAEFPGHDAA